MVFSTVIPVVMIFTNAHNNPNLQNKFVACISSMLKHSSVDIDLHLIADETSLQVVTTDLWPNRINSNTTAAELKLSAHDIRVLSPKIDHILGKDLVQFFRYSATSYYGDNLFFLSMIADLLFPELERAIMLDSDLKFRSDIRELWHQFANFDKENVFGLAYEQQPVYRHVFRQYRSRNANTRVGEPPPDGLAGFNSGVVLLHLDRMRRSTDYKSTLKLATIERLTQKYEFKGHLGDQDFYTLLSVEYGQLFYVLSCGFNRQLCTWWRDHGYKDVFDAYHQCHEQIKIYHGNCNTPIPTD